MCTFAEAMLAEHTEEFEMGRRYLANMMDADPENFTQRDIDVRHLILVTPYDLEPCSMTLFS